MKIIRELRVTLDEFYDFLESEFLSHINASGQQDRRVKKVKKGLHYTTAPEDIYTKIDYEILEYHRGERYVIQISSFTDKATTSYTTKATANGIEVTLEQEKAKINQPSKHKWFQGLSDFLYFGRLSEKLFKIEETIIKQRP